jgi:hypothetical protein
MLTQLPLATQEPQRVMHLGPKTEIEITAWSARLETAVNIEA